MQKCIVALAALKALCTALSVWNCVHARALHPRVKKTRRTSQEVHHAVCYRSSTRSRQRNCEVQEPRRDAKRFYDYSRARPRARVIFQTGKKKIRAMLNFSTPRTRAKFRKRAHNNIQPIPFRFVDKSTVRYMRG